MPWQTDGDLKRQLTTQVFRQDVLDCVHRGGVRLEYIQPRKPQQSAYIERYNRTVRYGWLGHYLFGSIAEVQ